jgi:hypothetical protein
MANKVVYCSGGEGWSPVDAVYLLSPPGEDVDTGTYRNIEADLGHAGAAAVFASLAPSTEE